LAEKRSVTQTLTFKKTLKKLKSNQKRDLDKAVNTLLENPLMGEQKKGDLSDLRVHKFTMAKQLTLLGYKYEDGELVLRLITFGSHENFYRDVNKLR
jgi:mRNA-degrading endonuclease RelE of RelBE toxin-antitoxin system